jgi:hypothetical protein
LDATSSVQTQLNSKQPSLSGLTSGDYIKATGTGSIGNATLLSESGTTLTLNGSIVPSSNGSYNLGSTSDAFSTVYANNINSVTSTQLGYLTGVTSAIQTQLNGKQATLSLNNSIVPVTNSSGQLTSSTVSSTTLGYLDATSSIQTQLNNKQSSFSGLTTGDYIKATSATTIGNASLLSESGTTISLSGNILYNVNNSSAGTGYPTMDSVYTFEFTVTASNIPAGTLPVGSYIPYPTGKSITNIRKLNAIAFVSTYAIPPNYICGPGFEYSIGANSSGIFITTSSTWTQTTSSVTFYVWITTT